jgi:hypothetical protein
VEWAARWLAGGWGAGWGVLGCLANALCVCSVVRCRMQVGWSGFRERGVLSRERLLCWMKRGDIYCQNGNKRSKFACSHAFRTISTRISVQIQPRTVSTRSVDCCCTNNEPNSQPIALADSVRDSRSVLSHSRQQPTTSQPAHHLHNQPSAQT